MSLAWPARSVAAGQLAVVRRTSAAIRDAVACGAPGEHRRVRILVDAVRGDRGADAGEQRVGPEREVRAIR